MSRSMEFTTALVTGGAGGIGKALAKYFIQHGKKVILVGRTESKLQSTANELGALAYYVLDVGRTGDIKSAAAKILQEHPEIDCLVNNAGIQKPCDVNEDFDLAATDEEISINISGPVHLAVHFVPHLKTKPSATIINVSSGLGFVPLGPNNPVYCATKAFMHSWTMSLRTQLRHTTVRVIEIAPPLVESDLHRHHRHWNNKSSAMPSALSMEEFMRGVAEGLQADKDTISAGRGNFVIEKWFETFGGMYEGATRSYYPPSSQ